MISKTVKMLVATAVLGTAALFGSTAFAGGFGHGHIGHIGHVGHGGHYGHNHGYAPRVVHQSYYLKKVVSYEARQEPYTKLIVEYDAYGCEVKRLVTLYRTIEVPVVSYVKVWY